MNGLLKKLKDTLQTLIELDEDPCQDLQRRVAEIDEFLENWRGICDEHNHYESRYGERAQRRAFLQGFAVAVKFLNGECQ